MNPIVIDKENAISSIQEILILISKWKTLEVKEIDTYSEKIEKSLNNAIKEHKNWEFETLLTIK